MRRRSGNSCLCLHGNRYACRAKGDGIRGNRDGVVDIALQTENGGRSGVAGLKSEVNKVVGGEEERREKGERMCKTK